VVFSTDSGLETNQIVVRKRKDKGIGRWNIMGIGKGISTGTSITVIV
jgi:hypothetical protein